MRCSNSRQLTYLFLMVSVILTGSTGCAVLYQLAHGDGPMVEAKYEGLEGQTVAVVCKMNASTYGDSATSTRIAKGVEMFLRNNVDGIDVIRQEHVGDWLDGTDWEDSDFIEIGRGVKADMVVAIDVDSFSTHESTTLFQGRIEFDLSVYDIKHGGREVFELADSRYKYPEMHPIPAISEDPNNFKRIFIGELSKDIAKNFYDYYLSDDIASDGAAFAQ